MGRKPLQVRSLSLPPISSNPSLSANEEIHQMTYEELYPDVVIDNLAKAGIMVPGKDDFTCNRCSDVLTCEFAWDLYNTQGDCVADK